MDRWSEPLLARLSDNGNRGDGSATQDRSSAQPADRCRGRSRRAHPELDRASDKLGRLIAEASPGAGGIPLARPTHPVTLKRWEAPIASGMQPESGGTFTIFNYPEYIDTAVIKAFGKKYGVTVKVTPFDDITTGVTKLASGTVSPDVTEMTPDLLPRVVAGKLVKPLNLDYIPNLKNVWSGFRSPYYDVGSRYGVPYTVYSTGIAYRTDRVKEDIPNLKPNPWDIFWHAQAYKGKTALLSEERETIAMALLHRGIKDINTEDPKLVNRAVKDLQELNKICKIKVGDLQY